MSAARIVEIIVPVDSPMIYALKDPATVLHVGATRYPSAISAHVLEEVDGAPRNYRFRLIREGDEFDNGGADLYVGAVDHIPPASLYVIMNRLDPT